MQIAVISSASRRNPPARELCNILRRDAKASFARKMVVFTSEFGGRYPVGDQANDGRVDLWPGPKGAGGDFEQFIGSSETLNQEAQQAHFSGTAQTRSATSNWSISVKVAGR